MKNFHIIDQDNPQPEAETKSKWTYDKCCHVIFPKYEEDVAVLTVRFA